MNPKEEGRQAVESLLQSARTIPDRFEVAGRVIRPDEVVRHLAPCATADRLERIDRVIENRTYGIATVVEGLANSGNVSAVMRTAEALGFQRFDVVVGRANYKHSRRTTQGADKWLDVRAWQSPAACVAHLRESGYRILVTRLDDRARSIDDYDFTKPTAVVFGNELSGVSSEMVALADGHLIIPTEGFARSLNISVAAALVLYHARQDRISRLGRNGDLTDSERERMRAAFLMRSVKSAVQVLERALETDEAGTNEEAET